ncbi:unnamed protein product [Pieris macdunnoughi]|uniref:5'-nucleotidase n=1 Tax=Pieris macdunnoughi TaxID=345717 RepID=A0A821WRJ8_9NEOP|nr:unnamed protein product [Pieris macdunnoughi]
MSRKKIHFKNKNEIVYEHVSLRLCFPAQSEHGYRAILHLTTVIAVIALSSSSIVKSPSNDGTFELLILHNNDMHARFEQTSQLSGACTTADRDAGKCYGGFPRVAHVVKEARKAAESGEGPPVLYLNAGDTYTGTAWFTIYKWKIAAEFLNALQPDAVSLGNNEFDTDKISLSPLMQSLNTVVIASNVIVNTPGANEKIKKSVVLNINNVLVGIVGYLTPSSSILDSAGNIEYIDEVLALTEEVGNLKSQNVDIIIALGQSSQKDLDVAREVEGVDLVIAGNQNIFYTNGTTQKSGKDDPQNIVIITQKSGKRVPVIKAYDYSKYLGKIAAKFDRNGELINVDANYIVLDNSIPQDLEAERMVETLRTSLKSSSEIVGNTAVVLDASTCKKEECNFGNLVTDSVILHYSVNYQADWRWTDAPIAIIHGGALNGKIAPAQRPGNITRNDLLSALPATNNLVVVHTNGKILKEALEHSVSGYTTSGSDRFLQFSGVQVTYNFDNEPGSRVVNVMIRCCRCAVPVFNVIQERLDYKIIMPSSLANGEFGYSMFENLSKANLDYDEVHCVSEFLKLRNPVYPEIADRITLLNTDSVPGSAHAIKATTFLLSLGNHEFDNGINGLAPFIANLSCPNLATNLILDDEPILKAEVNLRNSVVFDINGIKVAVIGYLTPDTKFLAVRNNVTYIDEVIAIRAEVKRLRNEGVQIFIALGHSGFLKDLEIAKEVEDIDLVIGGHTNTFLWNGPTPDIEKAQGPYPMIVKQDSGRNVPVVQAYAYTKYIGYLHLTFDMQGEIKSIGETNPILLNSSIPENIELLAIVNKYRDSILKLTNVIVGSTSVSLDGQSCRLRECNLGNMITDAIVQKYASEYTGPGWTDTPIAIIQGGGIRASISHVNKISDITWGDLLTVMPFDDKVVKVTLHGSDVRKMLEHSVAAYNTIRAPGQFLQISGMQIEYDFSRSPGNRVSKALTLCGDCEIPVYSPLNDTRSYNSLGNHEFDQGVSGLTPFIENLKSPVLAANLILTKVPELEKEVNLRNSIVFNISGTPIGVIGYLTPETKHLVLPNDVEYIEEVTALQREVKNLKEDGVKIIIALGHSGYLKDLEIAKKVDGLSLVIGGHTNTFLWNGTSPDSETIIGPYPTYVTQTSGKQVPVVQAYAYTKYLGKLHMVFNSKGELLRADGNPILLDNSIPQDPEVLNIINQYKEKVLNYTEEVIGNTSVVLDGLSCQHTECNLGNLIADAMVYTYAMEYNGEHWTDAPIAVIQGGGIRSSISVTKIPTTITKGDLIAVLPFEGILVVVRMTGTILKQMLEHAIANLSDLDPPGEFLQVSGLKVTYNVDKPIGSKVINIMARCWNCSIPLYSDVTENEEYNVIMPNFIFNGGDGYGMFTGLPVRSLTYGEFDASSLYIKQHSPVRPEIEGRSLGNHEFDEAVAGLVPFIKNLTSPVLAANLLLDNVPELKEETNLYKSIILNKKGVNIGIVGYLTPETKFLAPKTKVDYEDEIPSVRREVKKLKQNGIEIIIALGHSGFIKDLEIATEVEDIDLVIGGHSNTFLSNVNTTEIPEFVQGPYPTMVMQKSGRKVLVVQAYAYTKYMGSLFLKFNANGDIIDFDGKPILLNERIPQDPEVLQIVDKYHTDIDRINNEIVGTSMAFLQGDTCRLYECNLGDFICDTMLNYTKRHYMEFSQVNIAIVQGGRIRTSLDQPKKPYNLTRGDWITVIPFSDTLCIVKMNGSVLLEALEHSVDLWRKIDTPGQFLQMSGMEVTYDLEKIPGHRVIHAKAMCIGCSKLIDVRNDLKYNILMSAFLADGGDGYSMFENLEKEFVSFNEVTCVLDYLGIYNPINPQVDKRITILNEDKVQDFVNDVSIIDKFSPSSGKAIYLDYLIVMLFVRVTIFLF